MTWFKVDDKSAFHSKVVAAGNEAWGALCRAGAWSSGECTDGLIPEPIALMIAPKRVWKRLESCAGEGRNGLVERVDLGWQIHDFGYWNPPAALVKAAQAARHEKAQKAAMARWERAARVDAPSIASSNAPSIPASNAKPDAPPPRAHDPVPSRPVPSMISEQRSVGDEPPPVVAEAGPVKLQLVPPEPAKSKGPTDVERVFAYWSSKLMPKAKLDDKRRNIIARALKSYSVGELCKAVDGTLLDPHRMGQNERGRKYVDCDLVFRSADKIDPMIALADDPNAAGDDLPDHWIPDPEPDNDPPGTVYPKAPAEFKQLVSQIANAQRSEA